MPTPSEHKTVQARILEYAEGIHLRQGYGGQVGWTIVSREEAAKRRGGIPAPLGSKSGGWKTPAPLSLFFDDLLDAKVREFNPRYAEAEGALLGQFPPSPRLRRKRPPSRKSFLLRFASFGGQDGGTSREFVEHLRNRGKFFDHEEKRESPSFPDTSPKYATNKAGSVVKMAI